MATTSDRIVSDPDILFGKPSIRGTRIPVDLIVEKLADGESIDAILHSYPQLVREDVLAALDFAVHLLKSDTVYPMEA